MQEPTPEEAKTETPKPEEKEVTAPVEEKPRQEEKPPESDETEEMPAKFKKLYGRYKETERKQKDTESELQAMKRQFDEVSSFAKTLSDKLEQVETTTTKFKADAEKQTVTQQIQEKRKLRKEAWQSGDFDRADQLDDEIYELREQASKVAPQVAPKPTTYKIDPDTQKLYSAWIEDDDVKPIVADKAKFDKLIEIEQELMGQVKWKRKLDPIRWNEALRLYQERYEKPAPKARAVADPTNTNASTNDDTYGLSDDEMHVAKMMKISFEKYAKQKKAR